MGDDATVEQARRERFRAIYDANEAKLAAYALRRASTTEDAADLVADTFTVAWRRLSHVPQGDAATLWLFGVARRLLANQLRAERRRQRLAQRLGAQPVATPSGAGERLGELDAVRAALERMPTDQRDLLGLVAWEGLTTSELAAVLGCSTNAAKIRLHRARRRLLKELEEAGVVPSDLADAAAGGADGGESRPPTRAREIRCEPKHVEVRGQEQVQVPRSATTQGDAL